MHKIVNGKQVPLSSEEILEFQQREIDWDNSALDRELKKLRERRDLLLKETDFILMSDYPKSDKSGIIQYRQALRDITNNINTVQDINNLTWPVKPKI